MPRPHRLVIPGQPLHLIQRGNNRATAFVEPDDYRFYLLVLGEASARAECSVHAYALMRNHVHFLLTPGSERGPARLMQMVGRRYVRYFNKRYSRTGTLWEGRYRSTLIDSQRYFLTCSRYIELNPVRAGLVGHPRHYTWSSYRHNATGDTDPLVCPHDLYLTLGKSPFERQSAYQALFAEPLTPEFVDQIRTATNAGIALGAARSQAGVVRLVKRGLVHDASQTRLGSLPSTPN